MSQFPAYAAVVLDVAVDKWLDYGIEENQLAEAIPGSRVEVPVRGKICPGYIVEVRETAQYKTVKPIKRVLTDIPPISTELMRLSLWVAEYYCAPLRDVIRMILPPGVRKNMGAKEQQFVTRAKTREELRERCQAIREKRPAQAAILEAMLEAAKGMLLTELLEKTKASRTSVQALVKEGDLAIQAMQIDRSPLEGEEYIISKAKILNDEQSAALDKIRSSLAEGTFDVHLLHGVTGSGKTEVYLQAIDKALQSDKGAIMLVPEISLTSQVIERFRSRFQEKIAILHHRLSQGERHDEWMHIASGKAKIVIGARSAIFSPVKNLGLIIVDEEHEPSYKQQEVSPCYHARDVAVMRAKLCSCSVILGSATPSLESYHNVQKGKYKLSLLQKRPSSFQLPEVHVVDMKREFDRNKGFTNFSEFLLDELAERIKKGEQAILFLNRRGYHTTLLCQGCGHTVQCSHCEVPMTFHKGDDHLACHLCGEQLAPPPKQCPKCRGAQPLKFRGVGTEQIERSLHAIFPDIRTLRMDADTTRHRGSHQKMLRAFATGKADCLIGTQMIAKGLHFPDVTLVGVLNADAGLQLPDFRASESAFQLITQVAGRAGRGSLPGKVIIQTSIPDHNTIIHASKQDYTAFYQEEKEVRSMFGYPPFSQMVKFLFSGLQSERVVQCAFSLREALVRALPASYELHPVLPCGYAKIKDRYRFQFVLKAPTLSGFQAILKQVMARMVVPKDVHLCIDVNPASTF